MSSHLPQRADSGITPTISMSDFKFFKDCEYVSEYLFKRSAMIFYEISDTDFRYCSYNIKPEVDEEIREYLSSVDCWLYQKCKLLSLIKNIKEKGLYEWTLKKEEKEKKVDPFYTLRKKECN
jgi:hypothetical protein